MSSSSAAGTSVVSCHIPVSLEGERLDRAVATLTELSRTRVRALLEDGAVTYDGITDAPPSTRVQTGAPLVVCVAEAPPDAMAPAVANPGVRIPLRYVDAQLIVVAKPVGLVTHPATSHVDDTLVNGLLSVFPDVAAIGDATRPGIVHRLDRDTSGLLVVARTDDGYESLSDQIAQRTMGRRYLAVVRGSPESTAGLISANLGRDPRQRTRIAVRADGKPARTRYEVLSSVTCPALSPPQATLLACELETGRTHQIRVHLASIGLPILGDVTYGCVESFGANRPLLHASELTLTQPRSGERLRFHEPVPAEFADAAHAIGLHHTELHHPRPIAGPQATRW